MLGSDIIQVVELDTRWPTLNPFLFCVYHYDAYPSGNSAMEPDSSFLRGRDIGSDFDPNNPWRMYHGRTVPGFPAHPHRGFETLTIVRDGVVDHFDSMGATGRYGQGDTQWMTAGKGVQHSEMFPLIHQDAPNTLELFQIWINLPGEKKFSDPHFVMFWKERIPHEVFIDSAGCKTQVEVIAGALGESRAIDPPPDSWAYDSANGVAVWVIDMAPNARWLLPSAGEGLNRVLYFYQGDNLMINKTKLPSMRAAVIRSDRPAELVAGANGARILMLQGKAINEPVSQYGPFVMNTQAQIQQAFRDYQTTEFGGWSWGRSDPVHGAKQRRFARFSDGREEQPDTNND